MLPFIGIVCGLLVALISIIVQIGWFTHSIALVQISADFSPMKFNTALSFFFCAVNLISFNSTSRLLKSLGLLAVLLALITLSQYVFHNNNGIDSFFIEPFTKAHSLYMGRMSPATGVYFIIMGTLLFLSANFPDYTSLRTFVIFIVSIIIALTIVPLLAYISGIQTAYLWRIFTEMAMHSAICFILLGTGLICQIWAYTKETPYFLVIPVVLCLTTASFGTSGAIYTYENLKYQELLKEEAYYQSHAAGEALSSINLNLLHRESSYIAYFVLFFGLLTSLLLSLTIFFRIKWQQNVKALEHNEERLHLAITGTTDGLFDWDVATGEVYYSPRFEEVLGYQTHSLARDYPSFLKLIHIHDQEKFQQTTAKHFKNKTPVNLDLRLKTKAGTYIWFNFRGTPTCNPSGTACRMTGFIADISVRNEIDKMKNEFISTVSHELRTPMTSIRGSLALILGGKAGPCEGKIRDLLVIADRNCERLLRLINDILDIEKIEAGEIDFKLTVHDLGAIVNETVTNNQIFATKFNVKLTAFTLTGIEVNVDVDRMIQVLTNLISNAVKFSKSGDTVTITMQKENKRVRVNVIDQGQGISDDFKKQIFQKFSQADSSATRENKGSGLGLSISKAIMEALNGNLSFTSVVNQGTTFYLDLPIATSEQD
ncbi:MAG: PAS domain-containing sensor histidine kinase [Pseudomonadota bacterium]